MADATGVLNEISGAIDGLASQVVNLVPDDRSFMELWAWNLPAINRHEFAEILRRPMERIRSLAAREVSDADLNLLGQYPGRIQFVQANVLPNIAGGNAFHVYATVMSLVDGLNSILDRYVAPEFDWTEIEEKKLIPAAQLRRLKQLATGITQLSEKTGGLDRKIVEINNAHSAAEALPTDMASLEEARQSFIDATKIVDEEKTRAAKAGEAVQTALGAVAELEEQAKVKVASIEEAYSAATTMGLGKAFGDRAKSLTSSTWLLVLALAATLCLGGWISAERIEFAHGLINKAFDAQRPIPMDLLWVNVLLTLVSVAAPIWFAWLLTKQIGQRFRLAEDYGFKASVAKAYEGYRREAVAVDEDMAKRLLGLALDRLDEAPLRLVEKDSPGSPWQDFMAAWSNRKADKVANKP